MTEPFDVEFVRSAPGVLTAGVLYVSMEHAVVLHLCACGCGHQVVLELAPTEYTLNYDGEGITLEPSVGNWSFPCQSHYFVRDSKVVWAPGWTAAQIATGRARDAVRREAYEVQRTGTSSTAVATTRAWWRRLLHRLLR